MLYTERNKLFRRFDEELLCIEPWGKNSLRVRATPQAALLDNEDFALLPAAPCEAEIAVNGTRASIINGCIRWQAALSARGYGRAAAGGVRPQPLP